MQTITVAQVNQAKVDTNKFLSSVVSTKLKRELKTAEKRFEYLDAPVAERLKTQGELKRIAIGVIRRRRPGVVTSMALVAGSLQKVETEVEEEDYTRFWLGHKNYALFCFMSGHPGGSYGTHRLFVAQSLTKDPLDEDQQLVVPVGYDLSSVRKRFNKNVWDQNFKRNDAISSGRIKGVAMMRDPLYPAFSNIETYIGVEIPITGSKQKVKVFLDGRLVFMGLQPGVIEEPATREAALETIIEVIDNLAASES